ncbi:hypothetical protein [Absidia glauca]|uniref:Uncharacterized protein n=1 Tax=Absidia glauca TaxID=4829 RepID=A0A168S7X6_ABSGL|nr:hypothetical protein [Absidia glauca]
MGQSAVPPQSSASTPAAITGSANINPSNSVSSPAVTPTTKPTITEPAHPSPLSPQGPPILCSDQTVFELCLKNQDNYIKACKPEVAFKIVKDTCSQPGANVTLPAQTWIPPSSSILPSTTGSAPVSSSTASNSNHKSAANQITASPHSNDMVFLAVALMMVGWMF